MLKIAFVVIMLPPCVLYAIYLWRELHSCMKTQEIRHFGFGQFYHRRRDGRKFIGWQSALFLTIAAFIAVPFFVLWLIFEL